MDADRPTPSEPARTTRPAIPRRNPPREPAGESDSAIRFDRRISPRRARAGRLLAVILGGDGPARLAPVEMTDESATGVGILSSLPAAPGQSVGLYAPGSAMGTIAGLVARCDREGAGWRLGLRTRSRMVA